MYFLKRQSLFKLKQASLNHVNNKKQQQHLNERYQMLGKKLSFFFFSVDNSLPFVLPDIKTQLYRSDWADTQYDIRNMHLPYKQCLQCLAHQHYQTDC